jgi:hypothetical protein
MRKLQGALLAGAAAAALVVTASPAQASTYLGVQTYRFENTNLYIGDVTEQGLKATPDAGPASFQKWGVYAAPNIRAFKNIKTGRCMQGGWDAAVRAVACLGSPYQQFAVRHNSNGSIELKNVETDTCLTLGGSGRVYLAQCKLNNPAQSLH